MLLIGGLLLFLPAAAGAHKLDRDDRRFLKDAPPIIFPNEKAVFEKLEEMRTRYLLTFPLTGAEQAGEHRLEVRLKGAKGKVRSRRSYYVGASSPASRLSR